jgi:two-component system, OmpR family, response regulator ArlR
MKILVIEDEPELLQTIVFSLQLEHYVVETAADFDTALEKAGVYEYDCILLDITLPGGSGLQILEALKKEQKSDGVIIISARDSVDDRIAGLNLGADDYLSKPFHVAELHARVRSVVRRRKFGGSATVAVANLMANGEARTLSVDGTELALNHKEFDILLYLLTNKERLVTKTALAEHVWGDRIDEADSYEFIYSQIKNLRRKLKESGAAVEIRVRRRRQERRAQGKKG